MVKPFIIAEIGSNHNGDYNKLIKLINSAKKSGANAVKFQLFKLRDLNIKDKKLLENSKQIEFKPIWLKRINKLCRDLKIDLIFSFFSLESLKLIKDNTNCNYIKIASSELNNYELISKIGNKFKYIILSIGMTSESEILKAKEILNMTSKAKLICLHCVSDYPTKDNNLNLNYFNKIKNFNFNGYGLSDHTLDNLASTVSLGFGAMYFEKHLTLNNKSDGPDHFYALEPENFKAYIKDLKRGYKMLGINERIISKTEKIYGRRKGVYSKRNLKKGHLINSADIYFKSPALDLRDIYSEVILGKKINKNLKKDHPISLKDIY